MFTIDRNNIKKMDTDHYTLHKIDSYNKSINIILTGLASGKTTGVKYKLFENFINKGHKFLWVVRHVKDLNEEFLAEFMNEFEGYNFYINKGRLCAKDGNGQEQTVGYFVALSSANAFKRLALPKIMYIVFDEFILDPYVAANRYIAGEMKNLLILWDKVGRFTDFKTKMYLLGNPVEIANPMFSALQIDPMQVRKNFNKVYIPHEDIAVHYCETPSVIKAARVNTPYARVASRLPDYYKMAFDSAEEYSKNVTYLKHVPNGFRPFASFKTNWGNIYVYIGNVKIDNKNIYTYVTEKPFPAGDKPMYTFDSKKWDGTDTTLIDQFVDEKKTIKLILTKLRTNQFAASNEDVYMGLRDIIGYFK